MDTNIVVLTGNMTRDPETRAAGNTTVCNFSIGVNKSYTKKGSGEKVEKCSFIDVCCFGGTADYIGKNAKKGTKVIVQGELVQDQWTDKESGQKRSKVKVQATSVSLIAAAKPQSQAPQRQAQPQQSTDDDFGDETPF